MIDDLRFVPKTLHIDAGDAFVALCCIFCVAYILSRTGLWA